VWLYEMKARNVQAEARSGSRDRARMRNRLLIIVRAPVPTTESSERRRVKPRR
jgi:hypothetical protein